MPKRPSRNDNSLQHTEMTFSSNLVEWINAIIKKEGLPFGRAEVEIKESGKPQRADITLYSSPTSKKAICVIECKQPYENVFSSAVIEQASYYARSFPSPYFASCNGRTLAWFDAHEHSEKGTIAAGCLKGFSLASGLQLFSHYSNKDRLDIQAGLRTFLIQLYEHIYQQKRVPLTEINEFFVLRLQTTIEQLLGYYLDLVKQRIAKDKKFLKRVQDWFVAQGWNFTFQPQAFELLARQASYLLVNKIILYSALQQKWETLDKLNIDADMKRGGKLINFLEGYFKDVLKVDYQTIFSTDSLDIGFPEEEHAVEVIRILVEDLNRYNLVELGYEIIGALFERLIPRVERQKLGQYFTPAEIVDLMLMFCSLRVTDTVFDPAVGAGTFLVRAYKYKMLESYTTTHEDLLKQLWGCDIDPFPAHLAAINLAVRGLESQSNFPRILHRDFFKIVPEALSFSLPIVEDASEGLWELDEVQHEEEYVQPFDVIVGNPPYTRQESLGDLMPSETYKEDLLKQVFLLPDGTQLAPFSKRAGLHTYFFVHAYKFLKEGGRLAFITSNTWLNVDYGSDLQAFLLNHFKILAIIESNKETWFPELYVENCITILEKCSGDAQRAERNSNLVHFVRLHVPLVPDLVSPGESDKNQRKHFSELKRLVDLILTEDRMVSRDEFTLYPKSQGLLLDEGTDQGKKKYVGSRWSKFTSVPAVWQKLVDHPSKQLVPLSQLANLRCGMRTGANEFFYCDETEIIKQGIEQEYWGRIHNGVFIPNVIIKSPVESETVALNRSLLNLRVLSFRALPEVLSQTFAWSYIQAGEHMGLHARSTCTDRSKRQTRFGWYDLGDIPLATILWPELSGARYKKKVFCSDVPIAVNGKFYAVYPHDPQEHDVLVAVLNSTIVDFLSEFESTFYGGRTGAPSELPLHKAKKLLVPDIRQLTVDQKTRLEEAFHHYKSRPIGPLAQEYGTKDATLSSLDSIASDLRIIDSILMEEVLGLTESEQLSIYQTLLTLSSHRMGKAQRAGKQQRGKIKREFDEETFISTILHLVDDEVRQANLLYRHILEGQKTEELEVLSLADPPFRGKPELKEDLWGYQLVLGPTTIPYPHVNYGKALYRFAWVLLRVHQITMPVQIDLLVNETRRLLAALEKLISTVETYTAKVLDSKVRRQVSSRIWTTIKQQVTDLTEQQPESTEIWSGNKETG